MSSQPVPESFTRFVNETEPRLKIALCAAFGRQVGVEATVDALAYAWEHWERIRAMANPGGYVWKVGRNRAVKLRKPEGRLFGDVATVDAPWVEPGLPDALASLSERQRLCVLLIHGFDWTFAEVADLLGLTRSSVQRHHDRGMKSLQQSLKVPT